MMVVHKDHPAPADHQAKASIEKFEAEFASYLNAGHYGVLTTHLDQVVGYNFYAFSAIQVSPGICFQPGDKHVYSFGAYTHEDHRGLGLSPARWTFFRDWRIAHHIDAPTISYIALDNVSSLVSGVSNDSRVLGYSAWRAQPVTACFRSPGAKRLGIGFYKVSS